MIRLYKNMSNKFQTIAPEAIVYVKLKLPLDSSAAKTSLSKELEEKIGLEVQGEPVEIFDEYPTPILMAAFGVIHKVSPEMALRLKTGRRVLIFDHWTTPVIRDENIEIISEKIEHKKTAAFTPELVIDLEGVWKKFGAEENNLDAISEVLRGVAKSIKPAMITTLVGKAPALLFLLTQHLLYGKTGEIWYQENRISSPIRITRL